MYGGMDIKYDVQIDIDEFLEGVKTGKWISSGCYPDSDWVCERCGVEMDKFYRRPPRPGGN